jgi:hypothetical protein
VAQGRNRKLSCVSTENFFPTYGEKNIAALFSYTDFHLVRKLVLPAHGNIEILLFRAAYVFIVERRGGHISFTDLRHKSRHVTAVDEMSGASGNGLP